MLIRPEALGTGQILTASLKKRIIARPGNQTMSILSIYLLDTLVSTLCAMEKGAILK